MLATYPLLTGSDFAGNSGRVAGRPRTPIRQAHIYFEDRCILDDLLYLLDRGGNNGGGVPR